MDLEGTVINGQIRLDEPTDLPDGTRVRVEPTTAETFEYPHPMAPYDREKEVALLRERIAEMKAGVPGIPLEEAMARLATELKLPYIDAE